MSVPSKFKPIAELNDQLRARAGEDWHGRPDVPGQVVVTVGIAALTMDQKLDILRAVRCFSSFTEINDPYGEHDFGSFDLSGVGKVFWKIDLYEGPNVKGENGEPIVTRVLTIMLAEEY